MSNLKIEFQARQCRLQSSFLQFCKKSGGILAETRSKKEDDALNKVPELENSVFWLGLFDMVDEGRWIYSSDFTQVEWTNWLRGQPDNCRACDNWNDRNEDCVFKDTRYNGKQWNDYNCHKNDIRALCQVPKYY